MNMHFQSFLCEKNYTGQAELNELEKRAKDVLVEYKKIEQEFLSMENEIEEILAEYSKIEKVTDTRKKLNDAANRISAAKNK